MNIAVRYQSRGGNTKAVAEIIAKEAGVKAEPVDVPLDGAVDVLFLGGGVYAWMLSGKMRKFIKNLSPEKVKCAAAFSTSGGTDGAQMIIKRLQKKGIAACDKSLPIKGFIQPDKEGYKEQAARIKGFAGEVLK